jgi:hypothetical protein
VALTLINMPIGYCSGCRIQGPVGGGTRQGRGKRKFTRKESPWRPGPAGDRWWRYRGSEVNGGTGENVEVQGAGAEFVVAKPGTESGQRWSTWRQFPDGEGDGGSTDGGSRSSSQWLSGVGSRNDNGGIEGVLERWWRW